MENERPVKHKQFGLISRGAFRASAKKQIALFVGRAIEGLEEKMSEKIQENHLIWDTLCYEVRKVPQVDGYGNEIKGYILVIVVCKCTSEDLYTEEDERRDEEAKKKRREAIYMPQVETPIQ